MSWSRTKYQENVTFEVKVFREATELSLPSCQKFGYESSMEQECSILSDTFETFKFALS